MTGPIVFVVGRSQFQLKVGRLSRSNTMVAKIDARAPRMKDNTV
jgi:hypothetical protein